MMKAWCSCVGSKSCGSSSNRPHLIKHLSDTLKQALEDLVTAVVAYCMQQLALCTLQWLPQPRQKLQGLFQQYEAAHLVGDAARCITGGACFDISQCKVATNPADQHIPLQGGAKVVSAARLPSAMRYSI